MAAESPGGQRNSAKRRQGEVYFAADSAHAQHEIFHSTRTIILVVQLLRFAIDLCCSIVARTLGAQQARIVLIVCRRRIFSKPSVLMFQRPRS